MTNKKWAFETNAVFLGDNLDVAKGLPSSSFQLIYIDPPFNTGKTQTRTTRKSFLSSNGRTAGFKGSRYEHQVVGSSSYQDSFQDFWSFLRPRLEEAHRLLNETGTLYLHLDYREVHYARLHLDEIFGRQNFLNEIIWAYDYGARSKRKWPTKHDNILVYVKNQESYFFDSSEVDREPYMAPGLVSEEKAALGKLPTDVWWHTIVSPTGKEKTGYPTQKPLGILRRIIRASSREGDWVLDFFSGSGTTGAAAAELGRNFVLVDENSDAFEVCKQRLLYVNDVVFMKKEEESTS